MSLNTRQAKPGVHLDDTTRLGFSVNEHTTKCPCFYRTWHVKKNQQNILIHVVKYVLF